MNHLLARLKGRNSQTWKVMSQEDTFIDLPDLSDTHSFDPAYKLEDSEWYQLASFSTLNFPNPLIGTEFNTTNYSQLPVSDYGKIEYFCCKQGDYLLYQKFTAGQIMKKRWFQISDAPSIHNNQPIIFMNYHADAVYHEPTDILYFRDLGKITKIFHDIENLYREATDAEVSTFLASPFISLQNGYGVAKVGTANRKRIALAVDKLSNCSDNEKQVIFAYIKDYCSDIQLDQSGAAFLISQENHLKKVLFGIEERYYTTLLRQEKRLANSVQRIEGTP